MCEVTCGCPTGVGGGLLASPGEGQGHGELPTEHRTTGKHRPHTGYQGWDACPRAADLTGGTQGLPSVQLGSRTGVGTRKGTARGRTFPIAPREVSSWLPPPNSNTFPSLTVFSAEPHLSSTELPGGSEPIKNGELNTHELKNIYKVLFLGSSLSFSTVQSRVVWGKVGKRTIENVLWEAPQQNPEFRTEPTESGFWYSGAGNRGLYSPRVTVTAASPENTPANKTTFLVLFQLWLKFLLQRQVTRKSKTFSWKGIFHKNVIYVNM